MDTSDYTSEIPYGYCQCGCGQKAPLAPRTIESKGWVKGQPLKYIYRHYGHKYTYDELKAMFWAKVAITADDEKCWLWTGRCIKGGYGQKSWNNKLETTHRISWMIAYGEIPDGLFVLHKCDVRNCVNPKHLFLGNHQINMDDMVTKGRSGKGENNSNHKLNANQVIAIRERYALGGVTCKAIAQEYGVIESHINSIVNRTRWEHV